MPNADDIRWFKQQFQQTIEHAISGSLLTADMVTAVACQETGYIWQVLRRKGLQADRVLALCVGDTIDASGGRNAFPRTKAALLAATDGPEMFDIARKALVDMSQFITGYQSVAKNPDKFCHGFGIFQFDLQFFNEDKPFFLGKKYEQFGPCLDKCVAELHHAVVKNGLQNKTSLTDLELASVAITYNAGHYDPAKGLKQGHLDDGKFYGENFFAFLQAVKAVSITQQAPAPPAAIPVTVVPVSPASAGAQPGMPATPLVAIDILSEYKNSQGDRLPLPARMAKCTPDTYTAVFNVARDLAAAGGRLILSDMFRSHDMQAQSHQDFIAGRKTAFSPAPGGSFHEAGRAFDLDLGAIKIPLRKFWDIAAKYNVVPIIDSPDSSASEAWHFDCRGSHQVVYDYYKHGNGNNFKPYTAAAASAILAIGVGVDAFGSNQQAAALQSCLIRLGKVIGNLDGIIGKKTKNALGELGLAYDGGDVGPVLEEVSHLVQLQFRAEFTLPAIP
jgi:D-alanyl-D-alanine dipeptidase